MEIWKDIKDFEELYEVSNKGRIRVKERYVNNSKNPSFKVRRKSKIMSAIDHGNGYLYITLTKNGKRFNRYIHRLVASAFVKNPRNLKEVDHINRNRADNRSDNLRWVNHVENMANASMGGARDSWKEPKSGEKYIKKVKNRWRVVIARKDIKIDKSFLTIEEAIEFRNSLGKEVIGNVG